MIRDICSFFETKEKKGKKEIREKKKLITD